MIQHATLTSDDKSEPAEDSGSMIEVDLGTMVINEDDDDTMQRKFYLLRFSVPNYFLHRDAGVGEGAGG